ncbi:MAG: hypothetical protein M0Z95_14165, partial [Actinomycetota bacterium]|nr:hypothetical protein [Actinomycetota bacterium]
MLKTADGGSTWSAQILPTQVSRLTGVSCASTSVCEAVGYGSSGGSSGGVILGTTDGGSTWCTQ